ncbi:MAG: formylglycine-generating enzyme family protein [Anaerolineales bacterium]
MSRLSDGMGMVFVTGGSFMMGSTQAQIDMALVLCEEYLDAWGKCADSAEVFSVEEPQHEVMLDGFRIGWTEVTYDQYVLRVQEKAYKAIGGGGYSDDYPAAAIPWAEAAAYCAWAVGRLPTEAEWEYAAKGPTGSMFPWGDEFGCQYGNFYDDISKCDDGYSKASPVGSYAEGASWCGALDMAGNVWEWVGHEFREYTSEDQMNPANPSEGDEGILRGGSWGYGQGHVRTTFRHIVSFTANYQAVGFRCVVPTGER